MTNLCSPCNVYSGNTLNVGVEPVSIHTLSDELGRRRAEFEVEEEVSLADSA